MNSSRQVVPAAVHPAIVADCVSESGYEPWTPPFLYRREGQWIEDSRGNRLLDLRGWGYLTGKAATALGLDEVAARNIQNAIGRRVALLMNCDAGKSFNP